MVVNAVCGKPLVIGIGGESQVTAVTFDISAWVEEYGEGSAQLLHRRSRDDAATPVAVTRSGGIVTWPITESDTAYQGVGEAQLIYIPAGKTKKSAVWQTLVDRALTSPYNVPEPMEGWVDQVVEAGASAENSAREAAASETAAGESEAAALAAQSAAEDARDDAIAARNRAETARDLAEASAEAAARSVAAGGYLDLVTEDEHLIAYLVNLEGITFEFENERMYVVYEQ